MKPRNQKNLEINLTLLILNFSQYQFNQWEEKCMHIMSQVFKGLYEIHRRNIIHRDLKPSNLMIEPNTLNAKIIDFGLAINSNVDNTDQRCGTVLYEAPEQLFAQNQYSKAVDIWSCGIILFELLSLGHHPIWHSTEITQSKHKRRRSEDFRDQYKDIIKYLNKVDQDENQPIPESPLIKKSKMIKCYQKLSKNSQSQQILMSFQSEASSIQNIQRIKRAQVNNIIFQQNQDESSLNVEELDDQQIQTFSSGFQNRLGANSFNTNSILRSDLVTTHSNESSVERSLMIINPRDRQIHPYQSLVNLSPVKEVVTPADGDQKQLGLFVLDSVKHQVKQRNKHKSLLQTARSLERNQMSGTYTVHTQPYENMPTQIVNTDENQSTKATKTLRKVYKSPENQNSNQNFIQIKNNNISKNLQNLKKQHDKVRVIIQSSQAQQRKQSYLSDQLSKSPSPENIGIERKVNQVSQKTKLIKSEKSDSQSEIGHPSLTNKINNLIKSPKQLNPLKIISTNDKLKEVQSTKSNNAQLFTQKKNSDRIIITRQSQNNIALKDKLQSPKSLAQQLKDAIDKQQTSKMKQNKQELIQQSKSDDEKNLKAQKSPRQMPKELQQKLIGFNTSSFAMSFAQKHKSPDIDTRSKVPILLKKSSQLNLDKPSYTQYSSNVNNSTQNKSPQTAQPSTKRYKSQEQQENGATPYVNLMLMQIKEEMSKPFLVPIKHQSNQSAQQDPNNFLQQAQVNMIQKKQQKTKQQPINLTQGIQEYQSFLKNASARHLLQDEMRKIQEKQFNDKRALAIQGSQTKMHSQISQSANVSANAKSRQGSQMK
eukprot:403361379